MKLPNFSVYLPNKKFIFACLIGLVIIAAGFLIFTSAKKSGNIKQEVSLNQPVIAEEINKDSDADGLKDWEEALWKTDPNKPDTDKDGTPDGLEIKEGRDPLIAGNGKTDKIKSPQPEKAGATDATQETDLTSTLTEALGQKLLSEYMLLQQENNGTLSETDKEGLVNSAISALDNIQENTDNYLESDIKIASLDDEKTIKEYGNNLALIIKKYWDPIPETEMTIFQRALKEEKKDELNKLELIASAYRNTAKEIIALPTPASFANSHLKLANYFNNIAEELNTMQKIFQDPVLAMTAIKQYSSDFKEAYLILQGLNTYFSDNKVAFEENEPAEMFKIYAAK